MHRHTKENWSKRHHKDSKTLAKWRRAGHTVQRNDNRCTTQTMDCSQGQGKRKEVDREEDGEITSGYICRNTLSQ